MIDSQLTDDRPLETLTTRSRPRSPSLQPVEIRPTDGERLMRFWRHRDEAALAEVIDLHAPMVWGVCSQVLRRREDVEDAFQATFLILARKARSIRAADSAAGWLYRVAFRTALLARTRRNRMPMQPLVEEPASEFDQLTAIARNEQCRVLLEELSALPLQYRQPLVLCYLEGRSRREAADELGVTPQSVKGRLARGTRMLRSRMVTRGAALSTTMALVTAAMASAQVQAAPALISKTAALGMGFALKLSAAGATATAVKGGATILAEKGILAMTIAAAAKPGVAFLGACLVAGMFTVATADGPQGESAGGGAAIAQLADASSEDQFSQDERADVSFVAEESAAGEEGEHVSEESDIAVTHDGEVAEIVAEQQLQPVTAEAPVAAPASPAAPVPVAAPVPAAAAAVAAAPATPADVLISWAGGGPPVPVTAPLPAGVGGGGGEFGGEFNFRVPAPISPMQVALSEASLPRSPAGNASEEVLAMEGEYWAIKSKALKKKAEAMITKAQSLDESGSASKTEVLEIQADAELTLAEVKLCEVNALRIKEALEAAEAGKLKEGAKGVQVRMLQQALNAKVQPSPKLDVDGDFGPLTKKAVILLQKANGLKEDGVVSAKIWTLLSDQPNFEFQDHFKPREPVIEAAAPDKAPKITFERKIIAAGQVEAAIAAKAKAAAAAELAKAKRAEAVMEQQALAAVKAQLDALRQANEQLREQLDEMKKLHDEERGR
jgi:RNA polymerase sigma factor (sigma-70 family)